MSSMQIMISPWPSHRWHTGGPSSYLAQSFPASEPGASANGGLEFSLVFAVLISVVFCAVAALYVGAPWHAFGFSFGPSDANRRTRLLRCPRLRCACPGFAAHFAEGDGVRIFHACIHWYRTNLSPEGTANRGPLNSGMASSTLMIRNFPDPA
jgi:hypothetical protein